VLIKIDLHFDQLEETKSDIDAHVQDAEDNNAPIAFKKLPDGRVQLPRHDKRQTGNI
jgi:hypothetical protein